MDPYFCLYAGNNIVQQHLLATKDSQSVNGDFCTALNDGSLMTRSNLFEAMSAGDDCAETIDSLGYEGSMA